MQDLNLLIDQDNNENKKGNSTILYDVDDIFPPTLITFKHSALQKKRLAKNRKMASPLKKKIKPKILFVNNSANNSTRDAHPFRLRVVSGVPNARTNGKYTIGV